MEADWEFDIGANSAVIDSLWSGRVDLRRWPDRAEELTEAEQLAGLAEALSALNGPSSPVWTSKCDVWDAEVEFDADELGAEASSAAFVTACYIDLLPSRPGVWATAEAVSDWCRGLRGSLQVEQLGRCRVDLVIRSALVGPGGSEFGVTAYVLGCGESRQGALAQLSKAVGVFAAVVAGS